MKTDRSIHGPVWVSFALLVVFLLGFSRLRDGSDIWAGWIPARGLLQPDYAERILQRAVFRTPANTWSNLAYVLVGFYAIALAWRDRRLDSEGSSAGYLRATPLLGFLFGVACCYLGLASGLYHASLTRLAQQLDVASMYAPLLASLAIFGGRAVTRWREHRGRSAFDVAPVLVFLVVSACWLLFIFKWSMSAKVVLQTLIGLHAVAGSSRFRSFVARCRRGGSSFPSSRSRRPWSAVNSMSRGNSAAPTPGSRATRAGMC